MAKRQRVGTSRKQRQGLGQGTVSRLLLAGPLVGLMSVPALAGPTGEKVVHGTATFNRQGDLTVIRASDRAIINYSSFNLAQHESVRFIQPGASARVLNRIQSDAPTFIDGSIRANGQVYFVNRAGIVFGENSVLNVGGLYAAAGNISNRDFIAGNNRFTDVAGDVINQGRIEAGEIGLVGRRVANYGHIVAPQGMVTLASGDEVLIGERGGHVFARISNKDPQVEGGITQAGTIDSFQTMLSVGDHFALAVLDTSSMRGDRITVRGGKNSTVTVSGEIDATGAPMQRGGRVDVFGDTVVVDGAHIDASGDLGGGVIRIGGDYQGQGLSPTASRTLVTDSTLIRADALLAGSGGRVIVWSDQVTGFGGFISARGGALGGAGGFVEVSGKEHLVYRGLADVRATNGKAGQLLLDPRDTRVERNDDVSGGLTDIAFFDAPQTVTITDSKLAEQLSLLANGGVMRLQTTRDFTFLADATVNVTDVGADGFGTLIVEAGRRVIFEAGVTLDFGGGSFEVFANAAGFDPAGVPAGLDRGGGTGFITMAGDAVIRTAGGTIRFSLDNGFNNDQTSNAITISTIDAAGGSVIITHNGTAGPGRNILQAAAGNGITANSARLSIANGTGTIGTSGLFMRLDVGTIAMSSTGGAIFGQTLGAVTVGIVDGINGITSGNGNITLLSPGRITLAQDMNSGTGRVVARGEDIRATGGAMRGNTAAVEATNGTIGTEATRLAFETNTLAASATGSIFLNGSSRTTPPAGVTVGTVDGTAGITSDTGRILLDTTERITLTQGITASTQIVLDAESIRGAGVLRASQVGLNVGANGVGTNAARTAVEADRLAVAAGGSVFVNIDSLDGSSPVTIGTVATLAGVTGSAGLLKLVTARELVIADDITVAANARISGRNIRSTGGTISAAQIQLVTTGGAAGTIGSSGTPFEVITGRVAVSAGSSVFLALNELINGAGIEVGSVTVSGENIAGIVSTAGTITLTTPNLLSILSNITATGHGLSTNAINITAPTISVTGAPTVNSGTGGILLDLDSLLVNAALGGAFTGNSATLNIGTGGLNAQALFGSGFQNVTIDVDGAFETGAAGRFVAANNLSVIADSFTMAGDNSLTGTNGLSITSRSGLGATANLPGELSTNGVLAIETLGGDLELLGNGPVFASASSVGLTSSAQLLFGGAAPTTYQFSSLDAQAGTGIVFGAGVEGLNTVGALSLDAGTGLIDFQSTNPFVVNAGGGTALLSNIQGAGDLTFIGSVDATGGAGEFQVTLDGVLEFANGLDATGRDIALDTDGLVLGGVMLGNGLAILADTFSVGNDNGGFHLSNATLDNLGVASVRLGLAGQEATLATLDGVSTTYSGAFTIRSNDISAINNNSSFAALDLIALNQIGITGVALETKASNLHLEATNGILTTNATLRASGLGTLIDLFSDVTGTGNLEFDGDLRINGGGTRTIVTDLGTMRFVGALDAATNEALVLDAGTGELRFGSGMIGQGIAFSMLEMTAGAGIIGENSIAMRSDGSITLNNDLSTLDGNIQIVIDADGSGGDVGVFAGLSSTALGANSSGISVTSALGNNGIASLTFNGALATNGVNDNGVTVNAGNLGTSSFLSTINTVGGDVDLNGLTSLSGDVTTAGGAVTARGALIVNGPVRVTTSGGAFDAQSTTVINGLFEVFSSGGQVRFAGSVLDQTPGTATLRIDAGPLGLVRFEDVVGVSADGRHLSLIEVLDALRITFAGSGYRAITQNYNATFYDINRTGGGVTEFLSRGGNIDFNGGTINLFNGTDLTLTALNGGNVNLANLLVDAADADARLVARVRDDINFQGLAANGARLSLVDVVAGDGTIAGLIHFGASAFADTFTLTSDRIDFKGGIGSIVGSDMTILQRNGAFGITLGGDGAVANQLNLTKTDIDALADGFNVVRIGNASTNDINVVGDAGGLALMIRDPFELRTKGAITINRNITGTGDASLRMFADLGVVFNSTISTQGGSIISSRLNGTAVRSVILGDVRLLTAGGDVSLLGPIDAASLPGLDTLRIEAGAGRVDLGLIGQTIAIDSLFVRGGVINLAGIGTAGKSGVTGDTNIGGTGLVTFQGDHYNTNAARYFSSGGMLANSDITFTTNSNNLFFGDTGNAGRGGIEFGAGSTAWKVAAGATGNISLDGVYTGNGVNMSLTGFGITLAGNTTFNNANGTLTIDAPITGRNNLAINMGGGIVNLNAPIGSQTVESQRLRDLTISSNTINFNMARIDSDSSAFAASNYMFELPPGRTDQSIIAHAGNLTFTGGLITFTKGTLNFNANQGRVALADILGMPGTSMSLGVRGRDGVTLRSIGNSNNTGIQSLLIFGDELAVLGNVFVRGETLIRPFTDGREIALGTAQILGNNILEISQATFDRFRSTLATSSLNIGGIAASNDQSNPGFNQIFEQSNSLIRISDLAFGSRLNLFGQGIEILSGQTLTLNNAAAMRMNSTDTTRLNGAIAGSGGTITIGGNQSILASSINTGGGDLFMLSDALISSNATLNTLGAARDGNFTVTGGVQGLVANQGDFNLNVGRGNINLAPGSGIGTTTRLRSVNLIANNLVLSNVFTSGNQTYTGNQSLQLGGGVLNSLSGDIVFNNRLIVGNVHTVQTGGNGRIRVGEIGGTVDKKFDERLTLRTGANGLVEFRGNTSGFDALVVDADALMFGNRAISAGVVRFLGNIDSGTGLNSIEIRGGSQTEIAGNVGATGRFSSLMFGGGGLVVGQTGGATTINTSSEQLYENNVTIRGDVRMQAHGDGIAPNAADTIRFLGNVNGATAGADSLTIIVDRSTGFALNDVGGTDAIPTNMPVIEFRGNVGDSVRLGQLMLNIDGADIDGRMTTDGKRFSSILATIVFGDPQAFVANGQRGNFTVNVGELHMGHGEALTALGNFTLDATNARIADITTFGDMVLRLSNDLTIRNRPSGKTFDPITLRLTDDDGTDLVSTGSMRIFVGGQTLRVEGRRGELFEGEILRAVSLAATGANVLITGSVQDLGDLQIRSLPLASADLFISNGFVLDLRAQGPGNTNIAESIAGAVRTEEGGSVEAGTVVASTVRDILREIGLDPRGYAGDYPEGSYARQDVTQTILGSLDGVGMFIDVANLSGDGAPEITLERLERTITEQTVERYLLLWYGRRDDSGRLMTEVDPQTGAVKPVMMDGRTIAENPADAPSAKILASFEQVLEDCRDSLKATDPELAEARELPADVWMAYLMANESRYPAAATYVNELKALMQSLRAMGLSADELRRVWDLKLNELAPRGLDRDGFRRLVAGQAPVEIVRSSEHNGLAPVIEIEQ
ncbi:MAG: filamentous hemagglutinin N-terminal domain-containing protein [Phycisphaeraceae bacterium]|nr:filamentous hemagglutinin N-terminal domain-containing protein [Phycisphaeraceae bacterium]MCW5763378.1 filamentous hemagglutinin N-terminal domain-containing protein [Phycisphaeraceae bacterium]